MSGTAPTPPTSWADADLSRYLYCSGVDWFFWNESWSDRVGPYTSRVLAVEAFRKYVEELNCPDDPLRPWNKTSEKFVPVGVVIEGMGPFPWQRRLCIQTKENQWFVVQGGALVEPTPTPKMWRVLP